MKTSYILIGLVIVVVVIGGVLMLQSNKDVQVVEEQPQPSLMVVYNDGGYSPNELKITKGEIVTFVNKSSQPMWTASAIHPTHTAYPGTDIKNCQNAIIDMMFDSCAGTSVGESWPFQFNETGEWGYHDHLRPSHWGKVIVE